MKADRSNRPAVRARARVVSRPLLVLAVVLGLTATVSGPTSARTVPPSNQEPGECYDYPTDNLVGADGRLLPAGASEADKRAAATSMWRQAGGTGEVIFARGTTPVNGTAGDDVIIGDSGNNVIRGGGGDDLICGHGGNDIIRGEDGDDKILAGSGDDTIYGGDGIDFIEGNLGNDTIFGGAANDHLDGGGGDDTINGDSGGDYVYGNWGTDDLTGGSGVDTILSGPYVDTIRDPHENSLDVVAGNTASGARLPLFSLPAGTNHVALGDSFASGEGRYVYMPGGQECHRSRSAWPSLLNEDLEFDNPQLQTDFVFAACTGAHTKDILTDSHRGERPQIENVTGNTGLVSLAVGVNDVGFLSLIVSCGVADCITDPDALNLVAQASIRFNALENWDPATNTEGFTPTPQQLAADPLLRDIVGADLETVYRSILDRMHPDGTLLIVSYPGMFQIEPGEAQCRHHWLAPAGVSQPAVFEADRPYLDFSAQEADLLDRFASRSGQAIQRIADKLNGEDSYRGRVVVVNPTHAFIGHGACTNSPLIVPPRGADSEGFHPDYSGHRVIHRAVMRRIGLEQLGCSGIC